VFKNEEQRQQRNADIKLALLWIAGIGALILMFNSSLMQPTPLPPAKCVWVTQLQQAVCENE
jgi:hypothetical protein